MSVAVEVGLLSGKTATVEASFDENVGAFKARAEIALGVGTGRLMNSSGRFLDPCALMKDSPVHDALTLHISQVKVHGSNRFFCCHSWRWLCRDLG